MNELVRLLVELSEDPLRREEFLTDPEQVLGASGLSEEQRAALLTRDPQKILELFDQKPTIYAIFAFVPQPEPPEEPSEDPPEEPSAPPPENSPRTEVAAAARLSL